MPAAMVEPKVHLDQDTVWLDISFPQAMNQELA